METTWGKVAGFKPTILRRQRLDLFSMTIACQEKIAKALLPEISSETRVARFFGTIYQSWENSPHDYKITQ
jgi:hypothetical protein